MFSWKPIIPEQSGPNSLRVMQHITLMALGVYLVILAMSLTASEKPPVRISQDGVYATFIEDKTVPSKGWVTYQDHTWVMIQLSRDQNDPTEPPEVAEMLTRFKELYSGLEVVEFHADPITDQIYGLWIKHRPKE